MRKTKWGALCTLNYGKGVDGYIEERDENNRYRVFGTNGPIGWYTKPLFDGAGIIIGRKGAYRGVHFSQEPFFVIDTAYYLTLNSENVDLKWAYYQLSTVDINRLDTGAAIPSTKRDDFYNIDVRLPEINIQRKIASILSAYDELIENNRRRIQLLEESARLLYREWFAYLRFPGHEHVKVVDGVPEGWVKGTIALLGEVVTGKTPSTKESDNYGGEIPFIKTPDMHNTPVVIETEQYLSEKGANSQSNKLLPEGSIMVSCIGTVGVVSLNGYKAQTNQQINSVIPKHDYLRYYSYFSLSDLKLRLEAMSGGATMPNVNKSKFESLPIVSPKDTILREFDEFCKPIFSQIKGLLIQNKKLKQARDLLLPRLMNGEIEV